MIDHVTLRLVVAFTELFHYLKEWRLVVLNGFS